MSEPFIYIFPSFFSNSESVTAAKINSLIRSYNSLIINLMNHDHSEGLNSANETTKGPLLNAIVSLRSNTVCARLATNDFIDQSSIVWSTRVPNTERYMELNNIQNKDFTFNGFLTFTADSIFHNNNFNATLTVDRFIATQFAHFSFNIPLSSRDNTIANTDWVCRKIENSLEEVDIQVTGSTQAPITSTISGSAGTGGGTFSTTLVHTQKGIPAGTYKLKTLLNELVKKSHTQSATTGSYSNWGQYKNYSNHCSKWCDW